MPPPRSPAVATIRILAIVTLALYGVVVALLALTFAFPRWGEDPHPVRQPGDDFSFYLPPQFTAAVFVLLAALGLAALVGVIAAVRSRAAKRSGWAGVMWVLTGLALQGPLFVAVVVYGHAGMSPDPTAEAISVVTSALAFLLLPVVSLVSTRGAGSAGRAAGE